MKTLEKNYILNPFDFIRALTLEERYDILSEFHPYLEGEINNLEKWLNRTTIINEELFEEIMNYKDYDIKEYSSALFEDLRGLSSDDIERLSTAVSNERWFNKLNSIIYTSLNKNNEYKSEYGYSYLLRPFIEFVEDELKKEIKTLKSNFISIGAFNSLINSIATKMLQLSLKTFVLELNVYKQEGNLVGETENERFHSFIKMIGKKDNLINFFNEYTVLTRSLFTQSVQFVENVKELISRIENDKNDIQRVFNLQSDFELKEIQSGAGDTHQGGKSVSLLTFSNGVKIIYKPKQLKITKAYNRLLQRINKEHNVLDMGIITSLTRREYSYELFIEANSCSSQQEVQRYYQRYGQLLAIMYMLNGNDLHMENLITSGEYPYIVDLETLFQSNFIFDMNSNADLKSRFKVQSFVSNTLLLPENIIYNKQGETMDLSGLSGEAQTLSQEDYKLKNNYTDNAWFELENLEVPPSNNLVYLNGNKVDYKKYIEFIIYGFENVCYFFLENKKELLQEGGLISYFNGLTVRTLLRNTKNYAEISNSMNHPDYLRNFHHTEQILENIWAFPIKNKKIIESEYKDLLKGDIPIFFTLTNSTSVFDSSGKEIKYMLEKSGMDKVKEKFEELSKEDIKKQITVIKVKTGTVDVTNSQKINKYKAITSGHAKNLKENYIEQAKEIGDHLLKDAVICDKSKTASWVTVNDSETNRWDIGPVGGELYQGLTGISLFYHYLFELTNDTRYKKIRNYSFNMAMKNAMYSKYNSGLQGYASLLYPATKILSNGPGRKYKQAIQDVTSFLEEAIENYKGIDWMHGKSSVIDLLCSVYDYSKDVEYLNKAHRYAIALIKEYKENEDKGIISGFSHGYSGMATGLIRFGKLSGKNEFIEYGLDMLIKENELYNYHINGWMINKFENKSNNSWCRGSVGIGLSRLKIMNYINSNRYDVEKDITRAKEATDNMYPLKDDGLCHGNLGVTDFYLELYLKYNDEIAYQTASSIGESVIESKNKHGKYNLVSFEGFQPVGLFKGLTGIGYQFLRLADPHKVPSVLMFG